MSSIDYDVDSGGLMPKILALTAPPEERELNPNQSQSSKEQQSSQFQLGIASQYKESLAAHPYFRRPGRGHNHDSCDACKEGGDLICCDLCPASFHLTCHDPPLEDEDIPTGDWICHQCKVGKVMQSDDDAPSSNVRNKGKNNKRKERDEDKPYKQPKTKNNVKQSKTTLRRDEEPCSVISGGREIELSSTPLLTLIKAAASVNPTQFDIPYEMTLPSNFPGEPKICRPNGSKRGSSKKKPYELDNGLVPLPAKVCFQCNKSCRTGPLIPCDFCPLFYHLDCLNPPLTVPPPGLWMCPTHPQHFLDSACLRSHGLHERVKLWDKYNSTPNQNTVKMNFLHKIHRKNPPFRFKVKRALRNRVKVPESIKSHYKKPPDLMPPLPPSYLFPPPPHSVDISPPYSCLVRPASTEQTSCPSSCSVSSSTRSCPIRSTSTKQSLSIDLSTPSKKSRSASVEPSPSRSESSNVVRSMSAEPTPYDYSLAEPPPIRTSSPIQSISVDQCTNRRSSEDVSNVPHSCSVRSSTDCSKEDQTVSHDSICSPTSPMSVNSLTSVHDSEGPTKLNKLLEKPPEIIADDVNKTLEKDLSMQYIEKDDSLAPTKEEMNEWLSAVVCFQSSVAKKCMQDSPLTTDKEPSKPDNSSFESWEEMSPRPDCMNGDIAPHYFNKSRHRPSYNKKLYNKCNNKLSSLDSQYCLEKKSSSDLISDSLRSLAIALRSTVVGEKEVSLNHLDKSIVDVLAWQRLQQILINRDAYVVEKIPHLPARALLCPLYHDVYLNEWIETDNSNQTKTQPVPMNFRILNVGIGSQNHVDLSLYGHCNYVSLHHAAIIFDENTGHYELMNYSEHGTLVDCVLYHCDTNDKTVSQAPPPPLIQQVRAIIDKKRNIMPPNSKTKAMTNAPGKTLRRCNCKRDEKKCSNISTDSDVTEGWEGSAVLHHGSHLKFGCLQFVFSIVEDASKADWGESTIDIYQKSFLMEEECREQEEKAAKSSPKEENKDKEDQADPMKKINEEKSTTKL